MVRKGSKERLALFVVLFLIILFIVCCGGRSDSKQNASLPSSEPPFTQLSNSWVVDNSQLLSGQTIRQADSILSRLKDEGLAEVVILVQNGVKSNPVHYAAKYGRFLLLGDSLPNLEGGNRGLVWLIRPDGETKISVAPGEGLGAFTTQDQGEVALAAKPYIYGSNFDRGVLEIARGTDRKIRQLFHHQ